MRKRLTMQKPCLHQELARLGLPQAQMAALGLEGSNNSRKLGWPTGRRRGAGSVLFLMEKGRGQRTVSFVWEREPGTMAVPQPSSGPLPLGLPRDFYFYFGKSKKKKKKNKAELLEGGNLLRAFAGQQTIAPSILAKVGERRTLSTHFLRRTSQA